MTEWHVTPDYIVSNWTDELFGLMVDKLVERKAKELKATQPQGKQYDSFESLVARSGNLIKVVKKHGD